jgi:hypothetical protein
LQLAEDLLEDIDLPATAGNVSVVAASITAVAKQFDCSLSDARDWLEAAAGDEMEVGGDDVDRFWFEDAKYKAWVPEKRCQHQGFGLTNWGTCWTCYSEKHRGERPEGEIA